MEINVYKKIIFIGYHIGGEAIAISSPESDKTGISSSWLW
jgi:hypothetical protein